MTVFEGIRALATDTWPRPWRNGIALVVWIAAFVASSYAFTALDPSIGVRLEVVGEQVVVAEVQPWTPGSPPLEPGMIVTSIEGMQVVDGPEQIAKPDPDFLTQYGCCAYQNIEAVRPEDLSAYVAGVGPEVYGVYLPLV